MIFKPCRRLVLPDPRLIAPRDADPRRRRRLGCMSPNSSGLAQTQVVGSIAPNVIVNTTLPAFLTTLPNICGFKYEGGAGAVFNFNQIAGQLLGTLTDVPPVAVGDYYHGRQPTGITAGAAAGVSQNVFGTTLGTFRKLTCRQKCTQLSNSRFWIGLTGQASPLSSAALKSDNPAVPMVAFRGSAGVDGTWKAFVGPGSSPTILDTGISIDNVNSHLFEIVQLAGGILQFAIDSNTVATMNIPNTMNFLTTMPMISWIDNKGTTTSVSTEFYWLFEWGV